ncbi:hypothetical protein ACFPM0_36585 [Pseudonocardia sulfidoxydans]|uniref:hypothetical protein n=1 Tax=Pseudonocardia sulfidoxydans TaxID=54011 RepID=UPI00360DBDA9
MPRPGSTASHRGPDRSIGSAAFLLITPSKTFAPGHRLGPGGSARRPRNPRRPLSRLDNRPPPRG